MTHKRIWGHLQGYRLSAMVIVLLLAVGMVFVPAPKAHALPVCINAFECKIPSFSSGKCMQPVGGPNGKSNGTKVEQFNCGSIYRKEMSWTLYTISGYYLIRNKNAEKCLDVTNGGTANGTPIQLWDCNNNPQQQFRLQPISTQYGTYYQLRPRHAGDVKCIDLPNYSTANGTQLILWSCTGNTNQLWGFAQTQPPSLN